MTASHVVAALARYHEPVAPHLGPAEHVYGGQVLRIQRSGSGVCIHYAVQHEHTPPMPCALCGEDLANRNAARDVSHEFTDTVNTDAGAMDFVDEHSETAAVLVDGVALSVHPSCFVKSFPFAMAPGVSSTKAKCRHCGRTYVELIPDDKRRRMTPNHGTDGACFHNPGTTFAPDSASLAKASPFVRQNWLAKGIA